MGDPKFCWRRPTSAQLLVGCPSLAGGTSLLLETPLLWGRPSTAGNVSLLPEAPLFFLWGSCFFFLGRGDPVLLGTGHTSPFTGAPPLCWGCPSAVVRGAPLGRIYSFSFCNGAPLFYRGRPSDAGASVFCRILSMGRPYPVWRAQPLLEAPYF